MTRVNEKRSVTVGPQLWITECPDLYENQVMYPSGEIEQEDFSGNELLLSVVTAAEDLQATPYKKFEMFFASNLWQLLQVAIKEWQAEMTGVED